MRLSKISMLLLITAVISNSVHAQQVRGFKFAQTGSDCNIIQTSTDSTGNVYVLGGFRTEFQYNNSIITSPFNIIDSPNEPFILKTNSSGKPVYLKALVGIEKLFGVDLQKFAVNEKGELAAYFSFNNQTSVKIGERDIYLDPLNTKGIVVKFSKSGFLLWTKTLNIKGIETEIYPKDIKMDETGSVYLTGYFLGDSANFGNNKIIPGIPNETTMFLVKYNKESITEWCKTPTASIANSSGGIKSVILELGADGNIYVLGENNGNRQFTFNTYTIQNKGSNNAFIACYDIKGNALWASQCESDMQSIPEGLSINKLGEVAMTCFYNGYNFTIQGNSNSGNGSTYDLALAKFIKGGKLEWVITRASNNLGVYDDAKEAIVALDNNSNVYLALKLNSNSVVMSFMRLKNPNNILWEYSATSSDDIYFTEAILNRDNLYFSGYTNNKTAFSIGDITALNSATGYGVPAYFYGQIALDGKVKYIYNKTNTSSESVNIKSIGSDRFGGCYIIGNHSGVNTTLEQHQLGKLYANGMFISNYNNTVQVSGKVVNYRGEKIPEGQVKLIGYTNRQKSPVSDSVQIQNDGTYTFSNVPFGKYLLVASTEFADEDNYLPSYYVGAGHWEQAEHLEILETYNRQNIVIIMQPAGKMLGENKLSGIVSRVDENDLFKSTMQKPQKKGRANLARGKPKSEWEIIATTETDEYGNFSFSNVVDGGYTVFVEIPGIPHESLYNIDVSGGQFISNIDYLVGEETITATNPQLPLGIHSFSGTKTQIELYPNPSSGKVHIKTPENETIKVILIQDLQGKTIKTFYNISNNIILSDLPAGIYFANVISDNIQETIKFIITP